MVTKAHIPLEKVDEYRWRIPTSYKPGMRVPGLVYADARLLDIIRDDQALEQVANVAFLPGIVEYSYAMPDIHWGYGFPIGGVAAMRLSDGVVSPGGVGFDINCGVRLIRTDLTEEEVRPRIKELLDLLYQNIPPGLGQGGKVRPTGTDLDDILAQGSGWAAAHGYATQEDLDSTEENGCLSEADPSKVSAHARSRGTPQLGTLGSGNHFLEVQAVETIFDNQVAGAMGIRGPGQVTVMVHCGSRGLGHQVCQDTLKVMEGATKKYGIELPDRQLACAPIGSPEGQDYLGAMNAAANFAWCNRQLITYWVRKSFSQVFGRSAEQLGMDLVYDVCHNIAKMEDHTVGGQTMRVCVHRKGATRAFPPGHPQIPERYREVGQPVMIPGDMGRYSYLLVGAPGSMEGSFGSACHGAGRTQSRGAAKRGLKGVDIAGRLAARGITVRAQSAALLSEEASEAYKDVAEVVDVVEKAGLSRKVARMRPIGVTKG